MWWALLIFTDAKKDMVRIRPHDQQVIGENGSKKMTIMSVVGVLEPRKISLEAQHPLSNMTPPTTLVVDERRQNTPSTTPQVMRRQPTASPSTPPQPGPPTLSPPVPSTEHTGRYIPKMFEDITDEVPKQFAMDSNGTRSSRRGLTRW